MKKVLTAICVALGIMAVASPASAKWSIGNGATDLDIAEPALPGQVCATHVEGRAGLHTSDDPAVTPPPAGPYAPIVVQVFTGPAGSLDGAQGVGGGLLLNDGTTVIAPIATATTAAPTALAPPEEYPDVNNADAPLWEYAAAPFSATLSGVQPGDEIALRQGSHTAIATRSAIACSNPPPLTARIDVLPGVSPNLIIPSLRLPVLPVRVFGSSTFDVTRIATVKLGNASAVAIPPALAPLFAPRDGNHDGFLDRDYLFVPAATGIACGATSVDLMGTLTGGDAFTGTDAIRTIRC